MHVVIKDRQLGYLLNFFEAFVSNTFGVAYGLGFPADEHDSTSYFESCRKEKKTRDILPTTSRFWGRTTLTFVIVLSETVEEDDRTVLSRLFFLLKGTYGWTRTSARMSVVDVWD